MFQHVVVEQIFAIVTASAQLGKLYDAANPAYMLAADRLQHSH